MVERKVTSGMDGRYKKCVESKEFLWSKEG